MSTEMEADDIYQDDGQVAGTAKKYLLFHLGDEEYGVDIKHVQSIEELQKITAVPDLSKSMKGVINLRGQVIPVMDLRLRFSLPERDYDDRTCIIILSLSEVTLGIIVDTVSEVNDIPNDQIDAAASFGDLGSRDRFVEGLGKVGEEVKILLDVTRILADEDRESLTNVSSDI
jgi:purine-binding chemotaxis protein CheW